MLSRMSAQKSQGTRFETYVRETAAGYGLVARRLAEAGRNDEGDVEIVTPSGDRYIIECKAREALSLHPHVEKAQRKAGTLPSAVFWKRLVPRSGNKRRVAVGARCVVAVGSDVWEDTFGRPTFDVVERQALGVHRRLARVTAEGQAAFVWDKNQKRIVVCEPHTYFVLLNKQA